MVFWLKNLCIRRLFWTKIDFFFHAWTKWHVKFKVRQKSWIMSLCIIYHEECNNYKLMTWLQLGCNHSESCWSDLWPISCTILYLRVLKFVWLSLIECGHFKFCNNRWNSFRIRILIPTKYWFIKSQTSSTWFWFKCVSTTVFQRTVLMLIHPSLW